MDYLPLGTQVFDHFTFFYQIFGIFDKLFKLAYLFACVLDEIMWLKEFKIAH